MINMFWAQGNTSFKFYAFLDIGNKASESVSFISNDWIYYGLN